MSLGPPELLIVLLIVLVLFGGSKLPKLAKSLGEAQREFKKGQEDGTTTSANNASAVGPNDTDKPAGSGPVA